MPFSGVVSEKRVAEPAAHSARLSAGSTPGQSHQREKIQLPNLIKNSLTVSATLKNCEMGSWVNCLWEVVAEVEILFSWLLREAKKKKKKAVDSEPQKDSLSSDLTPTLSSSGADKERFYLLIVHFYLKGKRKHKHIPKTHWDAGEMLTCFWNTLPFFLLPFGKYFKISFCPWSYILGDRIKRKIPRWETEPEMRSVWAGE